MANKNQAKKSSAKKKQNLDSLKEKLTPKVRRELSRIVEAPYWQRRPLKDKLMQEFGFAEKDMSKLYSLVKDSVEATRDKGETVRKKLKSSSVSSDNEIRIEFKSMRIEGSTLIFEV